MRTKTQSSTDDNRWIDSESPLAGVEDTLRFLALGFSGGFKFIGIAVFLIAPVVLGGYLGHTAAVQLGLTESGYLASVMVGILIGIAFDAGAVNEWDHHEE